MMTTTITLKKSAPTKTKWEVLKVKAPFLLMGVATGKTVTSLVPSSNSEALQMAVTAVTACFLALTAKTWGRYLYVAAQNGTASTLSGHASAPFSKREDKALISLNYGYMDCIPKVVALKQPVSETSTSGLAHEGKRANT